MNAALKPLLTVEIVIRETYLFYGADIRTVRSPLRTRKAAEPRQVAMYLCSDLLRDLTMTQIGDAFRRDHTTVMHARDCVKQRMSDD